jgi:hypothetical protein
MTLVNFAEANVLHLKSLKRTGSEKDRLFDTSIKRFEASINSSPDRSYLVFLFHYQFVSCHKLTHSLFFFLWVSQEIINAYADALQQQAFEKEHIDGNLLFRAVARYQTTHNIEAIKEIIVKLHSHKQRPLPQSPSTSFSSSPDNILPEVLQKCYEIILTPTSHGIEKNTLEFIASYGEYLRELNLSNLFILDDTILTRLAMGCSNLCSLRLNNSFLVTCTITDRITKSLHWFVSEWFHRLIDEFWQVML